MKLVVLMSLVIFKKNRNVILKVFKRPSNPHQWILEFGGVQERREGAFHGECIIENSIALLQACSKVVDRTFI